MLLDLSSFAKAIESLDSAITYASNLPPNIREDIVRDSVIQRFEYTYELAWKLLQRWVKLNVSPEDADPRTKKDLFRLVAKRKLIESPESWFDFAEARNHTSHAYDEEKAEYVYQAALLFLPTVKRLFIELERHND